MLSTLAATTAVLHIGYSWCIGGVLWAGCVKRWLQVRLEGSWLSVMPAFLRVVLLLRLHVALVYTPFE